jgi:signal transduction histidine kinase
MPYVSTRENNLRGSGPDTSALLKDSSNLDGSVLRALKTKRPADRAKELSGEIRSHDVKFHNGLVYKHEQDLAIRGNRFWLKAVFRNLLRNAIVHGGKGCMVAVGLRDQGDCLRWNVYNTGKTVPQEYRDKLFTKFSPMALGDHGEGGGMGLGLYLVKEIVERHGGEIAYEAKRYGSNFVFTLSKE